MSGLRSSIRGLARSVGGQFRLPDDLIMSRGEVEADGPWETPNFTLERAAAIGVIVKDIAEKEDLGTAGSVIA